MNQIKTWQQRQAETGIGSVEAKDDEIRDLRQAIEQAEKNVPVLGMGISDNPYTNDADCNEPNSRAMQWHNRLLDLRDTALVLSPPIFCKCTDDFSRKYCTDKNRCLKIEAHGTGETK